MVKEMYGDIQRSIRDMYKTIKLTDHVGNMNKEYDFVDDRRFKFHFTPASLLLVGVFGASLISTGVKRILGRVRPNRENAGKFLGFTWRHDNSRESFPSSHSAAAVAMAVVLAQLYPPAAIVFWTLALICAGLRYLMDAHWPSDVLAGVALGHGLALALCIWLM